VAQDETESGLRAILNFGHRLDMHWRLFALREIFAWRSDFDWADRSTSFRREVLGLPQRDVERMESVRRAGLPTMWRSLKRSDKSSWRDESG